MSAVFLSASVPDPNRNRKYFESADHIAIRDAVTALAELVLPQARLYFGGHPAITPMVRKTAERLGAIENVRNYQSLWFREEFPPDNAGFRHMVFTQAAQTEPESVRVMRAKMLEDFERDTPRAAFFIGGMEGIEAEYEMVRSLDGPVPCYPIGSGGGASLTLLRERGYELLLKERDIAALLFDTNYLPLIRRLLAKDIL